MSFSFNEGAVSVMNPTTWGGIAQPSASSPTTADSGFMGYVNQALSAIGQGVNLWTQYDQQRKQGVEHVADQDWRTDIQGPPVSSNQVGFQISWQIAAVVAVGVAIFIATKGK